MIYEAIVAYCKAHHITISTFEKQCGIGNGTIGKWKNKSYMPQMKTLLKIVYATNTSIDDWIQIQRNKD